MVDPTRGSGQPPLHQRTLLRHALASIFMGYDDSGAPAMCKAADTLLNSRSQLNLVTGYRYDG